MKLALISFDGLDPRVIYSNRDRLDNFDKLIDNSMSGIWNTPGHTIPSYLATLTGRQYPQTNFYWDVDDGGFQRHRQTEFEFLWEKVDASMTLFNIPVLYPPEDIDDVMVCGMLTPDELADTNLAKPQEVQNMLNEIDYIHEVRADQVFEELGAEGMFDLLVESMDKRVKAMDYLLKFDSDLFYGVWTATDRWFHRHHTHGVDYFRMYEEADRVLGDVLDLIPDDIPCIYFSDHGFAHFEDDVPAHTGHMHKGFYAIQSDKVPVCRDDSLSIFDLYPTVVNYLDSSATCNSKGKILFHQDHQDEQVKDRLRDLGYLELPYLATKLINYTTLYILENMPAVNGGASQVGYDAFIEEMVESSKFDSESDAVEYCLRYTLDNVYNREV